MIQTLNSTPSHVLYRAISMADAAAPAGKGVQSVGRALDLLFLLSQTDHAVSASALAERLEFPRSTVYRLAETLMAYGIVARQRDGFVTTPKLFLLTSGSRAALSLGDVAEPHLARLVELTQETAGLHTRIGSLRRCVAEVEGYHGIRWARGVGFTAPLWSGAVGHVLLAALADADIDTFLAAADIRPLASRTVMSRADVKERALHARAEGWSASESETVEGASAIAAPVTGANGTIAAISLYAPASRSSSLLDRIPQLVAIAKVASDEWCRVATVGVPPASKA